MFIDDLVENFLKYERGKAALQRLAERQQGVLAQLNQDVHIRDLIVRTDYSYSFGESKAHNNAYSEPVQERLKAHISSLMTLANEDHRANYCAPDAGGLYQLKPGKENHVTRLSMPEFSLYTAEPLSTAQWQVLFNDIQNMAEHLDPNVHVLLSSFAVRDDSGRVLNMVLFIEGGNPPNIHFFAKNTASLIDVNYGAQDQLFTQQRVGNRSTFQSSIIAHNDYAVATGAVFEIKTKGGACYTQTVDICLDHATAHSQQLLSRRVVQGADPDELFPEQVEQCITSNSIPLYPQSIFAETVLHADSYFSMPDHYHFPLGSKTLSEEAKQRVLSPEHARMSIEEGDKGYRIVNPIFGSDCVVEVLAERAASKYQAAYRPSISAHNDLAKERFLAKARHVAPDATAIAVQKIAKADVMSSLLELKQTMLQRCRPGFWQKLFNTEEYKQKIQAEEIIHQSFNFIDGVTKKHGSGAIFLMRAWKNDFKFRLNHTGTTINASPLKRAFNEDIEQNINQLQRDLGCQFEKDSEDSEDGEAKTP